MGTTEPDFEVRDREIAEAISTLRNHGIHVNIQGPLGKRVEAETLFDGDDALFKKLVRKAAVYAEYGCGRSTTWAYRRTTAKILGVDTDQSWIMRVTRVAPNDDRLTLHWADVGPVGDWGLPTSFVGRANFKDYTDWIWSLGDAPDLVLVDGRFRVCSLLTTLKYAKVGTPILFDDYADRSFYHVVEEFAPIVDRCGRQALFEVTKAAKAKVTDLAIEQFRNVID